MAEMYKGIPFSPQVALADSIGAGDTVIKVTDVSAFPAGPSYATIGTDEEGETILYAAKTSDSLSGCTRGVEGTAKSWPAGTTIARNFTNKDFEALQENIKTAQTTANNAVKSAGANSTSIEQLQGFADVRKNLILSSSKWTNDSGDEDYPYQYALTVEGVTAVSRVDAELDDNSIAVATACGMCSVTKTAANTVIFKSYTRPAADLTGYVYISKTAAWNTT